MRIDELARDAGRGARRAAQGDEFDALDRLHRRRDRRRRNQRVVAGALAIGVTAVVAATALVVSRREVTPSGALPSGTIVYGVWNERIQQAEWFTVRTDGTGRRSIGVIASCAEWMPDGRLFVTNDAAVSRSQPLRPAVVDADGTDLRALDATRDPELNLGCGDVSSDGTRIVVEGFGREGTVVSGIYTVDASDGGDAVRLTSGPDAHPAFSPDGREVVFLRTKVGVQPSGAGALFVVPSAGGRPDRITPWDASFLQQSWSPDGEWIAFEHPYGELYLVHPDGTGFHPVPVDLPPGTGATNPSWSADGEWLIFSLRRSDAGEIWAVRPDGTGLQQILAVPGSDLSFPRWRP